MRTVTAPGLTERWFSFAEREPRFHLLLDGGVPTPQLACGYQPSDEAIARRRELPTENRPFNTPRCLRCLEIRRSRQSLAVPTRARGPLEPLSYEELGAAIRIVAEERWALRRLKPLLVAQGRSPYWPSTFTNGGCLIFAEALRRVLGGELAALIEYDDEDDSFDDETAASHVVAKVATPTGPLFLDATGPIGNERDLMGRAQVFGLSDFAHPIPFTVADGPDHEIGFDERLTADLAIALRAAFRGQRSLRRTS